MSSPRIAPPEPRNLPDLADPTGPRQLMEVFAPVHYRARSSWPCANPTCRAKGRLIRAGHAAVATLDGEHLHAVCHLPTPDLARDGWLLSHGETLRATAPPAPPAPPVRRRTLPADQRGTTNRRRRQLAGASR